MKLVALPENDSVSVAQNRAADPLTVDEGSEGALEILKFVRPRYSEELRVASGYMEAGQQKIGASAASDYDFRRSYEKFLKLAVGSLPFQSGSIHE
jgi:hypothetical protein